MFPSRILLFLLACASLAQAAIVEHRAGAAWPTRNQMRIAAAIEIPDGQPVLFAADVPPQFNPDSLRVIGPGSPSAIPASPCSRTVLPAVRSRISRPRVISSRWIPT